MRIEDVIAHHIRQNRVDLGMSQAQLGAALASYLGAPWPRQAVSNAEKGGRAFAAADLVALALVLGCTVETLLQPPPGIDQITLCAGPPLKATECVISNDDDRSLEDLRQTINELCRELDTMRVGAQRTDSLLARAVRQMR